MNGNPTAAQKRFHEWIRDQGCPIDKLPPCIHHIKGARMNLKGVKKAGEWYVIGLCDGHHSPLSDGVSVHKNKREFESRWATEKELWADLMSEYLDQFGVYPMPEEEYLIILERA